MSRLRTRHYKSFKFFILFLLVPALLSSCSPSTAPPAESAVPIKTQSGEKTALAGQGQYLSMTYTEYVNGKNADQGMVMRVMTYDLSSKKVTKLADVPYTSQYPLSVVSLPDHKIYYSAGVGDKGDQLFSYDLNTKKTNSLPIICLPSIVSYQLLQMAHSFWLRSKKENVYLKLFSTIKQRTP